MKNQMIIGIILIVLGLAGLVVQGVTYTSHRDVVDVAGVRVTAEQKRTVPVPMIAGGAALAAGVVLVVLAARKT
jgi:hypothetical protein